MLTSLKYCGGMACGGMACGVLRCGVACCGARRIAVESRIAVFLRLIWDT